MIAALAWLAFMIVGVTPPAIDAPAVTAALPLTPKAVLARYSAALHQLKEPSVITFDYNLEQTGLRTLSQTHRIFRAGNDERDELLIVNGTRVNPPKVRIFRGRRNRYMVSVLAPRVADYTFRFVGPVKDAHHIDYVFRLTPKTARAFAVTDVTIDGVRFLPLAIAFQTKVNEGVGSVAFGSNSRWWVAYAVIARATVAADIATERLSFYTYRFPATLPASTFTQARRLRYPAPASRRPAAAQPSL